VRVRIIRSDRASRILREMSLQTERAASEERAETGQTDDGSAESHVICSLRRFLPEFCSSYIFKCSLTHSKIPNPVLPIARCQKPSSDPPLSESSKMLQMMRRLARLSPSLSALSWPCPLSSSFCTRISRFWLIRCFKSVHPHSGHPPIPDTQNKRFSRPLLQLEYQ
jgi:hypothetical protein